MKASIAAVLALLVASPVLAQQRAMQTPQPTNVRLTFHLIEADSFQGEDADIRAIVTELRKLFRFQGYRLASKSILNATAWPPSNASQRITDPDGGIYTLSARVSTIDSTTVRLEVELMGTGNRDLIVASVNLADGKTAVLGSAKPNQNARALILAVTPTINP
ncbi:MAG: hypothetical protein PVH00_05305 [Gemmatimonadota bacterium]|jgi:hypothetical protein